VDFSYARSEPQSIAFVFDRSGGFEDQGADFRHLIVSYVEQ
jgi:hypothetical protein